MKTMPCLSDADRIDRLRKRVSNLQAAVKSLEARCRALEQSLGARTAPTGDFGFLHRLPLTRAEIVVASYFIDHEFAAISCLCDLVRETCGRGKEEKLASVYVIVARLRRKLEPIGIGVTSHYGAGYSIAGPERDRLRAIREGVIEPKDILLRSAQR